MIAEQLVALVYGSIVGEVINTCENMTEVNHRLQKIGYRIGSKIVDQYMKDMGVPCTKISELVQKFTTVGVKKFLGQAECKYEDYKLTEKGFTFDLKIVNNPLLKNLQILSDLKSGGLQYQSLVKGCFKGAFQVILIYQSLRGDKNDTVFFIDAVKM